jgi:hypothetical protein
LNALCGRGDQSAMTVNDLEQRVSDLERRHERTRGLLREALAAGVILLAGFSFRPQGWHAVVFGLAAGIFVPSMIIALFLRDRRPERANVRAFSCRNAPSWVASGDGGAAHRCRPSVQPEPVPESRTSPAPGPRQLKEDLASFPPTA